ncbi:hypothetical protein EV183_000740 [Coemansia sp. RSA 2336]|nr:hypothetical protein EV183_000740 [Coemansia sp. RSA 2336]
MEPGTHWATSMPVQADDHSNKQTSPLHNPTNDTPPQPMLPDFLQTKLPGEHNSCDIVPRPVRQACEFITDMIHLAMPSLFMAEIDNECPIAASIGCTDTYARQTGTATLSTSAAPKTPTQSSHTSEPGDVLGPEAPAACSCPCRCCTSHCCFVPSAATMGSQKSINNGVFKSTWLSRGLLHASWPAPKTAASRKLIDETMRLAGAANSPQTTLAWASAEPPAYSSHHYASAHHPDGENDSTATKTPSTASGSSNSSTADDAAPLDHALVSADKLLVVNQYLLRRIRKLELTNQIIKEAYAEVNEILEAERHYNTTQIQALRRKHDEDLEELANAYKERTQAARSSSAQSFLSSASDDEDDYGFKPGLSTTFCSGPSSATAALGGSASSMSSPLMGSSTEQQQQQQQSRPALQRSVSDTVFMATSTSLSIEFTEHVSDSGLNNNQGGDDSDDDGLNVVFESDNDTWDSDSSESSAGEFSDDSDSDTGVEFTAELVRRMDEANAATLYSSDSESGSEDESDDMPDNISDAEDDESAPAFELAQHISSDDYALVDPVQAVLSRYYSQSGRLSHAADIEDAVLDPLGDSSQSDAGSSEASECFHGACNRSADAHSLGLLSSPRQEKSRDEMEMEHNALLPADQRLAKFIHRASSHLQQGARGGLSLGFMLHNLEVQAEKFASNHASVLCAFVETLYRLAETMAAAGTAANADSQPRPALSKRQRDGLGPLQQAVARIVQLLHTFIVVPEDQQLILQQLEALSEANSPVRLLKHVVLLRVLYENELVDRGSIIRWYTSLPGSEESEGNSQADATRAMRGKTLREHASSLIIELATEDTALSSSGSSSGAPATSTLTAAAMEELHQQIQQASGSTSIGSNSASVSTPCLASLSGNNTGSLTPVSEEHLAHHPAASGSHDAANSKLLGPRGLTSTSYVSVMCRTSSALSIERSCAARRLSLESVAGTLAASVSGDTSGSSSNHAQPSMVASEVKPAKQVTFSC